MNTKTSIILIVSIMVIVGTTLTPILQQQVNAAALEARSQHLDQENLCFRSNTCRQSDVGQNTLGNDNSVTGFADQSDNLQQSTTASKTTPIPNPAPTPAPTPTTASLTVIKIVSGTTNATSSDFAIHVSGINPTPANFNGSGTGTDLTLGPGAFNVTETASPNFSTSFSSECSGTIAAGQHLTCTITNTAKTCVECFTSLLNSTQIRKFLEEDGGLSSIEEACAGLQPFPGGFISESALRSIIVLAADVRIANELIACLKNAGIVFGP